MEDNSCSDDEIKISPSSPKLGTKKLKLNDGSSQDSIKETREYFFLILLTLGYGTYVFYFVG